MTSGRAARVRLPLWVKLTLGGSLLAAVPALWLGFRAMQVSSDVITAGRRELALAVTEDVARTLDAELGGAQSGLDAVGRAFANLELPMDARVVLAESLVGASPALDHATLYDAAGGYLARIVEPTASLPEAAKTLPAAWTAEASTKGAAIGGAHVVAGEVRVPMVVAIRAAGGTSGFVMADVSLARVQARVAELARQQLDDEPEAIYVVDAELKLVAHPDAELALTRQSRQGQGPLLGVTRAAFDNQVAASGDARARDGREVLTTFTPLAGQPFAVITEVARDRAYAPVTAMRRVVLATLASAVVLALVAALVFARSLTAPIRQLVQFARELAGRRFDRRVEIATRDELALLGRAMSDAAHELGASEARIREEEAIRADLGRYLPAELVDRVVAREQDMGLGGVRRPVTVVFADVVGFTALSESLGAEQVVTLLNEMFTILTEIVFRHGGTVDKFMGDCVLAMWGAPTATPDHAARALRAAQDMIRWMEVGQASWRERYGVNVRLAVGVNTGDAVVGNIGSSTRMDYTAIGDVVNVAARVESIARPQQVLVTAATRAAAGDGFQFLPCGERELTGRSGTVELFEVRP